MVPGVPSKVLRAISYRLNAEIHQIALPVLVSCYFLVGTQLAPGFSRTASRHTSRTHSTSRDSRRNSQHENLPFWTNHKHKPEKLGMSVQNVATTSLGYSAQFGGLAIAASSEATSILRAPVDDPLTGRAPPPQLNLI